VPFGIARVLGRIGEHLPGRPLTHDQVRMLKFDNVVSPAAREEGRTLQGLGVAPTPVDVVLPTYLAHFRERGEFSEMRPAG
jgi:NADH dehydrogenase